MKFPTIRTHPLGDLVPIFELADRADVDSLECFAHTDKRW